MSLHSSGKVSPATTTRTWLRSGELLAASRAIFAALLSSTKLTANSARNGSPAASNSVWLISSVCSRQGKL